MHGDPSEITFYEGLIRKTASMYAATIQEEYEDIVSILRIKVWRALIAYDASRSNQPVERSDTPEDARRTTAYATAGSSRGTYAVLTVLPTLRL